MSGHVHILCIETSGQFCSVALSRNREVLTARDSAQPLSHNATLAPFVMEVLNEAGLEVGDLSAIAVSAGPGSYTGLRVGISLAKALCFGADKPFLAIDTLRSLAMGASGELGIEGTYYANVDARRMEVYTAPFDAAGHRLAPTAPLIIEEGTFDAQTAQGKIVLCGSGTSKCQNLLSNSGVVCHHMEPKAGLLVNLAYSSFVEGDLTDPTSFRPEYIKPPNITAPRKVTL